MELDIANHASAAKLALKIRSVSDGNKEDLKEAVNQSGLPHPHGSASGYETTGPGGSSQHGGGDNPTASNSLGLLPVNTSGPSSSGSGSALGPVGLPTTGTTSNFPEDVDIHNIPSEFKKEGTDWFAISNPKVKRVLDVNLVHTLMHERCVYARYCLII